MSQTGQLTVRPTSAIRKYLNDDTDALTAAKQLNTDAVLEGSVQRAADRLRVSVNLLRTSDGTSLWNDSFDLKMTDIFAVQDTVSQQVASRLSLKLDQSQQVALTKRYTSNPTAYEYYQKAMFNFDSRYESEVAKIQVVIDLLRKAIEADPNFALAHAQLAYASAENATYNEPTNPTWEKLYEQEIERATELDPQLAEIHLAKSLFLWSAHSGYQTKAAIRELLAAQQIDPNIGHAELGFLYGHIGLTDLCARELQRAAEIDPTSDFVKQESVTQYFLIGDYDGWAAAQRRQYGETDGQPENSIWYLLGKRRLDDLQKRIDEPQKGDLDSARFLSYRAILYALRGNYRAAEDEIPGILSKGSVQEESYHHVTFNIACVYAIEGKSEDAVKWLRKTAETGYPNYPRFEREESFDRIKQSPEFVQFMSEMKTEFESYKSEFGGSQ
jgi:tetratricopeptide (TPR) repeat protein